MEQQYPFNNQRNKIKAKRKSKTVKKEGFIAEEICNEKAYLPAYSLL